MAYYEWASGWQWQTGYEWETAVSVLLPDYDYFLPVEPQEAIEETQEPWQVILQGTGYEEKRISLGDTKSYVTLRWPLLTREQADNLFAFYLVVEKKKTFKWTNPRDSQIYVVRFDEDFKRTVQASKVYSIEPIKLRVFGVKTS